jgi:DNA modification methylase
VPRSSRSLGLPSWHVWTGDCRDVLPMLPDASFDACICDPPYPCIKRPYGMLTEAEWHDLMRDMVPEVRRVLKPRGSAVFILQPYSERVGRMRPWLWEFLVWLWREWNVVQDVYWWNHETLPSRGATHHGLCRPSVKTCVWAGPEDCHRDQGAVLWEESVRNKAMRLKSRAVRGSPSGRTVDNRRMGDAALKRGGVTPFNLLPLGGCNRWEDGGGAHGHGASTPLALCDWWIRYLVPLGGAVLDPFCGSGTVGVAALRRGCTFVGVEKEPAYVEIARKRLTTEFKSLLEARKNAPTQA